MPKKTPWIKLSEKKPSSEDTYKDFLILYENPHFIHKTGFSNPPRYIHDVRMWDGARFSDDYKRKAVFWMPIPPAPEGGQ